MIDLWEGEKFSGLTSAAHLESQDFQMINFETVDFSNDYTRSNTSSGSIVIKNALVPFGTKGPCYKT